jgi:PAT family beta-lactamase induction signal transducer AmpG
MTHYDNSQRSWGDALRSFAHPRVLTMLFLGFSAGIPILLIFSSLSLWLREAGVERAAVTFFSWAALGYSFKFVWAPLVDRLPLPWLTRRLGRRRAWMLLAQCSVILAILWMASIDPAADSGHLFFMAMAAVLLGFSSATQDIVVDAYRIESAESDLQAMMSSSYIAGYRIGMLVAGAGALFLASYFGSERAAYSYPAWRLTYIVMAATMLVGVMTTLLIAEPREQSASTGAHAARDYLGFVLWFAMAAAGFVGVFFVTGDLASALKQTLSAYTGHAPVIGLAVEFVRLCVAVTTAWWLARLLMLTGLAPREMVTQSYLEPVRDFFRRYGVRTAWLLLALVGVYRISDIVLGVISNVFYQDLGFSKIEIASIVKTFGLFMTIAGGFLGGLLSVHYGVIRILLLGALLSSGTNLLFLWLAYAGHDVFILYAVISADNLAAGLASAAFVAFLSSLTNVSFTAVQYAIFSSLMTLLPKVLGGYSGGMVDDLGYPGFFVLTTLLGLPVLWLVWFAGRRLAVRATPVARED